jgi:phosphoserine phosphatase RsbU/P
MFVRMWQKLLARFRLPSHAGGIYHREQDTAAVKEREVEPRVAIEEDENPRGATSALVVVKGPRQGTRFPLDRDVVSLGRSTNAQIVLASSEVSRLHSRILQRDGSFFIEDLQSPNGTYLNGRRLSKAAPLADGDSIQIGPYTFAFQREESAFGEDTAAPPEDLIIRARVSIDPGAADFQGPTAGQQLQAVLRVGQLLARTLDLDKLLFKVITHLGSVFQTFGRKSVVLRRGDELVPQAQHDWLPGAYLPNEAVIRLALRDEVGVLAGPATVAKDVPGESVGTLLCAPLIGQEGLRLGAIVLEVPAGAGLFNVKDLRLLTAIAVQAAVFIENAARHAEIVGGRLRRPRPASPSLPIRW